MALYIGLTSGTTIDAISITAARYPSILGGICSERAVEEIG
jgi:hypothetical protein